MKNILFFLVILCDLRSCSHYLLLKPRALHGIAKGNISTSVLPLFDGLWP